MRKIVFDKRAREKAIYLEIQEATHFGKGAHKNKLIANTCIKHNVSRRVVVEFLNLLLTSERISEEKINGDLYLISKKALEIIDDEKAEEEVDKIINHAAGAAS